MNEQQAKYIAGLREIAAFFEEHPELVPVSGETFYKFLQLEALPQTARAMGRAQKQTLGDVYFTLTRSFGPHKLQATWDREKVCEKVVVGQEAVEERVPVIYETRTVMRDKVEWKCPKTVMEPPQLPSARQTFDAVVREQEVADETDVPF